MICVLTSFYGLNGVSRDLLTSTSFLFPCLVYKSRLGASWIDGVNKSGAVSDFDCVSLSKIESPGIMLTPGVVTILWYVS